ncbi:MAG: hypothetical protein ACRCV7_01190 [Culicoidibacterales bacterium]
MNKQLIELICIRLRNQFEWSKLNDENTSVKMHARLTTLGYLIVFIFAFGYILLLPYQMNQELQLDKVNPYVVALLFWFFGIWTLLFGVGNLLVGTDHNQVFVLPLEEWQVKLVNIISSYIVYLPLCGLFLFSVQIPLYFFQPFPLINLLMVFAFVIMIPLLAIGSSVIVSIVVKVTLSMLNFRNTCIEAVLTLLIFIYPLVSGYLVAPINLKSGLINTSFLTVSLLEVVLWSDWLKLVVLFAASLIVFGALCLVITKKYNQLIQRVGVQFTVLKKYTLEIKSPLVALFKKELSRYFSSFTYVVNTLVTPLALFLVASGLLMGVLPKFTSIPIVSLNLTITSSFIYFVILIVCLTLTTTTSCSFSFEGKNIWIIQSLPISVNELSLAKGLLNILLFIPGLIVALFVCWNVFELRGIIFIVHGTFLLISLLCITFLGLAINLKFPNFNWSNEMVVVKQGGATIITSVASMLLISLSAVLFLFLGTWGIVIVTMAELLIIETTIMYIRKTNYL